MSRLLLILAMLVLGPVAAARAQCTDPAGAPGKVIYNADHGIMQYCGGEDWVRFPKRPAPSCALGTWTLHNGPEVNPWHSVSFANGIFLAAANTGTNRVMTSTDGITWTPRLGTQGGWNKMAYGNGVYVAVRGGRNVLTSPDGETWTVSGNVLPNNGNDWLGVAFGNGVFVAVSGAGTNRVAVSSNGTSWAVYNVPLSYWNDIAFGNGRFVAVAGASADTVMSSADGINWDVHPLNPVAYPWSANWNGVTYGGGQFVIVGGDANDNHVMTSPDGITWTPRAQTGQWNKVAYLNGLYVAVAGDGANRIMTSTDGVNWVQEPAPQNNEWRGVAAGNGRFVAVSSNGTNRVMMAGCGGPTCQMGAWAQQETFNTTEIVYGDGLFVAVPYGTPGTTVYTSTDGANWTPQTTPAGPWWYGVTYGDGLFVAVGNGGTNRIMTSTDGINWVGRTAPENNHWIDVTYGDGRFVAVSHTGTNRVMSSADGITWTPHAATAAYPWDGVAYGNGRFVAVAEQWPLVTDSIMTSTDGMTWVPATPLAQPALFRDVIYAGGQFVAIGDLGHLATSPDGINWTLHAAPPSGNWVDLAYGGGLYVATGWSGTNKSIISTNGVNWTPVAVPGNVVLNQVAYGNGRFVTAGANGIYRAECEGMPRSCTEAGQMVFNADHRVLQYCDGSFWHAAGPVDPPGPSAGCTSPARDAGKVVYNADHCALQYCDGDAWRKVGYFNPCDCGIPDPCLCGSPTPGTVCGNGTVYAGQSADGNLPMFTTPADAGLMPFNNGNWTGYVSTAATSWTAGAANTWILVQADSDSGTGGDQPHIAARYCYCLGKDATGYCAGDPTSGAEAHGKDDWYLPSWDELNIACTNRVAIGGFNLSGTYGVGTYRTSEDNGGADTTIISFNNCSLGGADGKAANLNVRCVRKGN